ncbi:F0F1 ATP synthase subunit gamma [Kineobactrum sediminis]|uniref:F0F1 ATP synthase subunit gamma n=1 Tax=Kineobactrum sediminis TaxID=1905677 RepID=A0A2N5Y207_9GAMM|nr:F0F1 ATP synthase subunit gamma [Kineobactrum sediminis]PLW82434.1 F0F1 ATP synthase subunit gamma [Kineobactrum sediminis]
MESLENLHRQLGSLEELQTIVRTMKALSAASIQQYELSVRALTDYYQTVERGLHVVLKDMHAPVSKPSPQGRARLAAVVFGSDHGLCGRFNEEISQHALERMDSSTADPDNRLLLAVGARAAGSLEYAGQTVNDEFPVPGSARQITETVQQVLVKIDEWREQQGVYYVYLFYNRHSRGKGYHPTGIELFPINLRHFKRLEEEKWPSRSLPVFSMKGEALLSRLLYQYLFVSVFRACAESQASEHASRLAAMQSAEKNLDERLDEVTMTYRRARQNVITSELLDVVAGFEAITSAKEQKK